MSDVAARSLLIELGTEELPVGSVDHLAEALLQGLRKALSAHDIPFDDDGGAQARAFCTPRRLAVRIPNVALRQRDRSSKVFGPSIAVGLDTEGKPTPALLGFAARNGVNVESLLREMTDKGERFVCAIERAGQPLATLLPNILVTVAKGLPIAKPMRWSSHDYSFVRPLHWLVVLHGDQEVDAELFGIQASRHSRGHRFMDDRPVRIADADAYVESLRAAKVIVDPAERRHRIHGEVARAAARIGGRPQLDPGLLDLIANLTEWPVAVGCTFDASFLTVPQEALIGSMVGNQKFVPLLDDAGQLLPHFIGVANIQSLDETKVGHGYERVIRPRFADAKFFFEEDLKTPLASYQQGLAAVVDQPALGSLWDKTLRVAQLARLIAGRVGADAAQAAHAASLAKCDLLTRMVGEFPELQGIMGRTYAAAQGESPEIARALDEVYMPRNAGDGIATSLLGRVVAVAERADTLAGLFAIGGRPSGAKDPYGLRRAALGLARTLIEGELELDTHALLREALDAIPDRALAAGRESSSGAPSADKDRVLLAEDIERFIGERLRGYYAERGIAPGAFDAVLAIRPASLADLDRRLLATVAFTQRPECATLAAANKRVANILRRQAEAGDVPAAEINPALLEAPAERELAQALGAAQHASLRSIAARDYASGLSALANLDGPIARFFDEVKVITDDFALRANRLALLAAIQRAFNGIADLARL